MAFLTDQIPATGVNLTDLFHIVDPNDLSQGNPAGSSYKACFQQVLGALTGGTSVMIVGSGIGSVERCGNNNDASRKNKSAKRHSARILRQIIRREINDCVSKYVGWCGGKS